MGFFFLHVLFSDVLGFLSQLEVQARCRRDRPSRVKELRAEVEALRARRDLLRAEIETHKVGNACRVVESYSGYSDTNNTDHLQLTVLNQA